MQRSNVSLLSFAPVFAALALFLGLASAQLKAQSVEGRRSNPPKEPLSGRLGPWGAQLAAGGGQALPGGLGQNLGGKLGGIFNPLAPREPMAADPNHAFPRVPSLPGPR
jgi:hypothetical protein